MRTFERSRPGIAAQAVGIAQGALEVAARYAKERRQFGRTIGEFQMVQEMLADMHAEISAARLLVYEAARALDAGRVENATAATAKLFASAVGVRAAMNAVQILGGYGYTRDFPAERYLRDAKVVEIGAGTSQIMRVVIARELLA